MTAIVGLLSFSLFIAFIIGFVKPALVLRWTNKPTRLKVFGYWILATTVVGGIGIVTESDEEKAKSSIEAAKNYIEQEKYPSAISKLKDIDKENPLYNEAQILLQNADSLSKIAAKKAFEEEKLNQKDQLEREIKSINDGVDFTIYRGTADALQMQLYNTSGLLDKNLKFVN